jgi:hypothetical protein
MNVKLGLTWLRLKRLHGSAMTNYESNKNSTLYLEFCDHGQYDGVEFSGNTTVQTL